MKNIYLLAAFLISTNAVTAQQLFTPGGDVEPTVNAGKDVVLKTNDNAVNQGFTFQNSGGHYTWRIFRELNPLNAYQSSLRFGGGSAVPIIEELANRMTLSFNGDLQLHNGDLRLENGASKLFLGQNNAAGPHGIVFDDETGSKLELMYRSGPNQLIIETTQDENPIFTVDADNSEVYFIGNVGIGTENPSEKLHVQNKTAGEDVKITLSGFDTQGNSQNSKIGFDPDEDLFYITNQGQVGFSLNKYGNVGIGMKGQSNNLGYELAVNGIVGAKEVVVEISSDWPDYVFASDYQLPNLIEVEKHIKENQHLPGIPSAKEVHEKGISLGEMNTKLLEKVEELTLYVIALKKEVEEMKKESTKQY